jgi:predicted dehydrogenase
MNTPAFPRRRFLKSAAALAAATTLPGWFLAEAAAAERPRTRPLGPNDQPAVALVGCGGMGRANARNAARFGRVVALCDVDDARIAEARKEWPDASTFTDFRRVMDRDDIHVVICGTVDHWHTLVSLAAMRAGKDVYCEKPLTLTIAEGRLLADEAKKTGRILQTGSQQRSEKNFRLACELVRNGRVGKASHVDVWLPAGPRRGPFAPSDPPAGFNWDLWLGPVPATPFVKERAHGSFRYWWDYSGGTMTDWGAHHNDIALWGLGLDRSGPVAVEGRSLQDMIPGGFDAFAEYEVKFTYADGVTQFTRSTVGDNPSGGVIEKEGQRHGVKFTGPDGWIWVTRGSIEASAPELLTTPLPASAERLYASDDHMGNFFDCLRSRKAPICEAEIGHRSATVCHLGVIAARLGRPLKWDPAKERFVGDREADGWIARAMRKPWSHDAV